MKQPKKSKKKGVTNRTVEKALDLVRQGQRKKAAAKAAVSKKIASQKHSGKAGDYRSASTKKSDKEAIQRKKLAGY